MGRARDPDPAAAPSATGRPGATPLEGRRVVTTRGSLSDDRLGALLEAAGARVTAWSTCEYPPPADPAPLEAALAGLGRFDWVVFTSARAVTACAAARPSGRRGFASARASGVGVAPPSAAHPADAVTVTSGGADASGAAPGARDAGFGGPGELASGLRRADTRATAPRVAAVGPATARAATGAGWTVAVEGRGPGARGLAARVAAAFPLAGARDENEVGAGQVLGQVAATLPLAGARVLFPAASGAAPTVEEEFAALGARVTRVEAYRTVVTPPPAGRVRADLAAGVDAVAFASPSAVEAVRRALDGGMGRALAGVVVACIGPTTKAALARAGVGAGVQVAARPTLAGMVDALAEWFGATGAGAGGGGGGGGHSPTRVAGRSDAGLGRASHGRGRSDAGLGRGSHGCGRSDATMGNTAAVAARLPGARP